MHLYFVQMPDAIQRDEVRRERFVSTYHVLSRFWFDNITTNTTRKPTTSPTRGHRAQRVRKEEERKRVFIW
jgi:hypothetical protein